MFCIIRADPFEHRYKIWIRLLLQFAQNLTLYFMEDLATESWLDALQRRRPVHGPESQHGFQVEVVRTGGERFQRRDGIRVLRRTILIQGWVK